MRPRLLTKLFVVVCLTLVLGTVGLANGAEDAAKQATKASMVFKEIMDTPDKGIPDAILEKTLCVAVFPRVIKGGFALLGARFGRGVASCRTRGGWSAPAFFNLTGGSFGLQLGGQATDFVLLFINEEGLQSLLKNKFELGGEASAAAGPVGRETGASTDLYLSAKILSYSRSKGLFAGLELKGAVISRDDDTMRAIYGDDATAAQVLRGTKSAPASVNVYPNTLAGYSKRKK